MPGNCSDLQIFQPFDIEILATGAGATTVIPPSVGQEVKAISRMRAFSVDGVDQHLSDNMRALVAEVNKEPENQILNVDEEQYIKYLVDQYRIEPIVFDWDSVSLSQGERHIPAEQFPPRFNVYAGKSYPKQTIVYKIPFSGETALLHLRPSTFESNTHVIEVANAWVSFEIINWSDDPDAIKRAAAEITGFLRRNSERSAVDVHQFNENLASSARDVVQARKLELKKRLDIVFQLGVAVEPVGNVPETFAVPVAKKTITPKPETSNAAFAPDPTLNEGMYDEILRIIHESGVEMERHPAVYADKDEESLRDHFLMVLAPHFQSATGETFNRVGKTDILIRHDNCNIFVAECAIWNGKKAYLAKIGQALSYLTWRDSKAAIILFIKNMNLQPVLDQIDDVTPTHPCWVSTVDSGDGGWFRYKFHLPDDSTRGLSLSIGAFHFPG